MTSPDETEPDAAAAPVASTNFASTEAALLAEALDVAPERIVAHSREPLGAGSVAGFEVHAPDAEPLAYYVDTSRLPVQTETGLALGDLATPDARVWLHPADPHVPALSPAAFGGAAETLLARLGLSASGVPKVAAYRPGRRAVLRVDTESGRVWIKVVRPSRVERIVRTHEALRAGGVPVPAVLGWSPEGLLVIADATGTPATDFPWEPAAHLDAVDVLRSQLAGVPLERRAATAAGRMPWYAPRVADSLSAAGEDLARFERLGAQIDSGLPGLDGRDQVGVHGDLHYGQLFFSDTPDDGITITSVIDVDTAGIGDPAEDSAAFIGHAVASALITDQPDGAARVWSLADLAAQRWGADAATRSLTAIHLVGHALSAFDRADHGNALALLRAAEAVLEGHPPSAAAT